MPLDSFLITLGVAFALAIVVILVYLVRMLRDRLDRPRYSLHPAIEVPTNFNRKIMAPERQTLCSATILEGNQTIRCILITVTAGHHNGDHVYGTDPLLRVGTINTSWTSNDHYTRRHGTLDEEDAQAIKEAWLNQHATRRQEHPNE